MTTNSHRGLQVSLRSTRPVPIHAEFDCTPGEWVALVGASGSGKTTLLRTVAGLYRSADMQGLVRLDGQDWMNSAQGLDWPAQQRSVGLVFQHYALFPHLNAINNIALCADSTRATGSKGLKNRALEWLARLGLEALALRMPHELSGGQQQRVALARALVRIESQQEWHGRGGVLLLDEPFSAVDAPMRQVLYRELAQLRQSLHVPIVLVTHDLHEARRLADRLVIIDAGHSLQSGTPAQVMRSPRNARVAELVGIHNHFHARFEKTATPQQALLHWGSLQLRVADKGKIDSDTAVTWVLAGEAVQLLSSAEASTDPFRNTVLNNVQSDANLISCTFTEMLALGEISLCRLAVLGTQDSIQLNLPTAQLVQQGFANGQPAVLRIPVDAAHIMPLRA
jgi:molybdate transport system ATP-binding protein